MNDSDIIESSQNNLPKGTVLVDYRNNYMLLNHGVSFHWWCAGETTMHTHNFYEFFMITEGKACHELNGNIAYPEKNRLFMIRPSDLHQFRISKNENCVHMNICIVSSKLKQICDALCISLSSLESRSDLSVRLSSGEADFFLERAKLLSVMQNSDEKESISIMCELVAQAVATINRTHLLAKLNYPEWFTQLLEKINSPENSACSAADVYCMGGFSPPVMVEYFKKFTGKTVASYLRELKCNRAGMMLRSTNLSILEISEYLGYDSLSHFNRIFKEYYGIPPAHYRKSKKEEYED